MGDTKRIPGDFSKPEVDSSDNITINQAIGNKSDTVAGDSLISSTKRIEAAVGGAAGHLKINQSESQAVEEDAIISFGISLFDTESGGISSANIDITGISAVLEKSTGGAAFSVAGITQPTFSKATGLVSVDYRFLAGEWEIGDIYKLVVSGITAIVDGDTAYISILVWSNVITEFQNIETKIDTIDTVVDAIQASHVVPTADSADNVEVSDVAGNKTDTIDGNSLVSLNQNIKQSLVIITGTSPNTAGTANTSTRIELDASASAVDGAYDPAEVVIVAGTGIGQSRCIWEYEGATKYASVNRDWKVIPDDTSVYMIKLHSGDTHVNEGVAQGGANNSITLNDLAASQNNVYQGQCVYIVAGTGADQTRMIISYNGTSKIAIVESDWIVNPDSTSIYSVIPFPGFIHGVPSVDSAANVLMRDVIGNKDDTHNGSSLAAIAHTLNEDAHNPSKVYPMMKVGVTVTSAGTAYTLGAAAIIVGTTQNLDNAATSNPSGTITRVAMTSHNYVVDDYVRIVGMDDVSGPHQVVAVSDANHFDFDAGVYTAQTPPGDASETTTDIIPEDFDIHYVSIEALSANGVYELVVYDDGVECGRTRFTKNANQDGTMDIPIQTIIITAESVITAKLSTDNAAGDTATISVFYHLY